MPDEYMWAIKVRWHLPHDGLAHLGLEPRTETMEVFGHQADTRARFVL